MKVALLTDKFTTGGGLEHIYQLCRGMPDVQFGVFGKDGEAREKFAAMPNVQLFFDTEVRTVNAFGSDIVHYHHLRPLLSTSMPGARSLFTVHGVHLHKFEFQSGLRAKLGRMARLTLEKFLYRRVDRFITVSAEDRAFLLQHYGVDSTTIYNGIDFAPIEQAWGPKEALRRCLGLPLNKQIYLTVARFDFPKGYDVLVHAIAQLQRENAANDRVFVFAGDGALLAATQALAASLGVSGHIMFLGRRTDVYKLMTAADVFVLPSRWEGLPLTLIEALVARLPAVASRTYGNATVQREAGDNVRLFENENPADLARALLHPPSFTPCDLAPFQLAKMVESTRKVYLDQ
jgi:glycosyltransferase involved in cell wall biosynthesis